MYIRKFILLATVAACAATAARAEEATQIGTVDELVVTAQKRAQRITDVPISISAFDSRFLEQIDARGLDQVAAVTRGFVLQLQNKFAPGFSIRGVTSDEFQPYSEQRVAVFQDGVPVTQATGAFGELFDLDRIEVQKGPASTLYGRSALNGGVSMYQKRAAFERSFEGEAGIGTHDYRHIEAVANLPLSDTLAVRFGALRRLRDGPVKDLDGSGTFNALDAQAYRFALAWRPTDKLDVNLVALHDRDDPKGGVPFKSGTFLPLDQTTGRPAGDLSFWTPTHLSTFGTIPSSALHRRITNVSLTAAWTINPHLTLTSISGYRWFWAEETGDNDGTPTEIIAYDQYNDGLQYSQELRLNFTGVGPVEGFVGASAVKSKNGMRFDLGYDERAMALLLGGRLQALAPNGLTNSQINAALGPTAAALKPFHLDRHLYTGETGDYDLFGDVTWHATDKLDLTAGGRVTRQEKTAGIQGFQPTGVSRLTGAGIFLQPTPGQALREQSQDSTEATWRAAAKYAVTPDINVFAAAGVGKRPPVLQPTASGPFAIIPGEKLTSYEAGVKARLFRGRLVADASVFHYDYENFQTRGYVDGVLSTINAGEADADGFEGQATAQLTEALTVFASYGYNHARLRSGAYSGNRFRNSPDHKFAIGGRFDQALAGGVVSFQPLYTWQSKMFFSDDNDQPELQVRTPAAFSDTKVDELQKGFGLLSARLTYTPDRGRWSVALIGQNLTDERFLVDAGNLGDSFGIPTFISGPRRQVQAEFSVKF